MPAIRARHAKPDFYTDAEAALQFLAGEGIRLGRLVLWGESLGSGLAIYLAACHKIAGLILEAPFTSVAAAAQRRYPFVPAALSGSRPVRTRCRG